MQKWKARAITKFTKPGTELCTVRQPRTGELSQETSSLPRASDMPHFQFGIFTESNDPRREGRKRVCWHSIFMPQWSWQETRALHSKGFSSRLQECFNNGPTFNPSLIPAPDVESNISQVGSSNIHSSDKVRRAIYFLARGGGRADSLLYPAGRASKGHKAPDEGLEGNL